MTRRLLIAAVLALMLCAAAVGYAIAQVPTGKHYACSPVESGGNAWKPFYYLNKAQGSCPAGWTELDWVDD